MPTIKDIFGRDPTPHMLADKGYTEGKLPISSPDLVVGLELEIENWEGENKFRGFDFHEDNSLRGSSIEAVTRPTKAKFVETLLQGFFFKNGITERNYSERCGTHVHMNVSDMTEDEVASFCLLYQVFERLLFDYVGGDRDNNIFCVPWEQAGISYDLLHNLRNHKDLSRAWRKYTALNLLPIYDRGSVEFRHLPGTCDVNYLIGWINLIGCMRNFAMAQDYKETQKRVIDLNTSSAYRVLVDDVFGQFGSVFNRDSLQEKMENGVLNVKLMSISDLAEKKTPEKKDDKYQKYVPLDDLDWPVNENQTANLGAVAAQQVQPIAGQWVVQNPVRNNLVPPLPRELEIQRIRNQAEFRTWFDLERARRQEVEDMAQRPRVERVNNQEGNQ